MASRAGPWRVPRRLLRVYGSISARSASRSSSTGSVTCSIHPARRLLGSSDPHGDGLRRPSPRAPHESMASRSRCSTPTGCDAAPATDESDVHRRRLPLRPPDPRRRAWPATLLGIFDAIAPASAGALQPLDTGDASRSSRLLRPSAIAPHLSAPTYSTRPASSSSRTSTATRSLPRGAAARKRPLRVASRGLPCASRCRRAAHRRRARHRTYAHASSSSLASAPRADQSLATPADHAPEPEPDHDQPLEPRRGTRRLPARRLPSIGIWRTRSPRSA